MRRTILLTLLLLLGTAITVFRVVRAQNPPTLPTITFYATYPFHTLNHPTGISATMVTGILYLFISDSDNNVVRLFNDFGNGHVTFSTFAGTGTAGYANGALTSAMFNRPSGVKGGRIRVTISGRTWEFTQLYVSDSGNYATRLVCSGTTTGPSGYPCSFRAQGVYTLIGAPQPPARGHVDGNATVAEVAETGDIGLATGHLYLADAGNNSIRAFDFTNVSTYAGTGQPGYVNGFRTNALFNAPTSISGAPSNTFYVTDAGNHVIRKIDAAGNVTTLAGTGEPGFQNGTTSQAQFYRPTNVVCCAVGGYAYIADSGNNMIRRVDVNGNVTTFAGATTPGLVNGSLAQARFNSPTALSLSADATFLYVSDTLNNCIRRIDITNGVVSTYIN